MVIGALAIIGLTIASAATLGGLNPKSIGSGGDVVASCDDSVAVSWNDAATSPVYSGSATVANSTFNVTTVKFTGVAAACDGKSYKAVVADGTGTALASMSGTIALSGGVQTITFTAVNSKTVEQVVLTIYDA